MTTQRQIEANRENAKKSTGPASADGKQRSSKNAMTHGILSQQILVHGEDPDEFDTFRKDLADDLSPVGPVEELLVDQMVSCMWRYRRLLRVETGLFEFRYFENEVGRHDREAESHVEKHSLLDEEYGSLVSRTVVDREAYETAMAKKAGARQQLLDSLPQLGRGFAEDEKTYSALARYKSSILRDYYKAYHELERLQRSRGGESVCAPVAIDVNVTGTDE
jgi:hypothetical protein